MSSLTLSQKSPELKTNTTAENTLHSQESASLPSLRETHQAIPKKGISDFKNALLAPLEKGLNKAQRAFTSFLAPSGQKKAAPQVKAPPTSPKAEQAKMDAAYRFRNLGIQLKEGILNSGTPKALQPKEFQEKLDSVKQHLQDGFSALRRGDIKGFEKANSALKKHESNNYTSTDPQQKGKMQELLSMGKDLRSASKADIPDLIQRHATGINNQLKQALSTNLIKNPPDLTTWNGAYENLEILDGDHAHNYQALRAAGENIHAALEIFQNALKSGNPEDIQLARNIMEQVLSDKLGSLHIDGGDPMKLMLEKDARMLAVTALALIQQFNGVEQRMGLQSLEKSLAKFNQPGFEDIKTQFSEIHENLVELRKEINSGAKQPIMDLRMVNLSISAREDDLLEAEAKLNAMPTTDSIARQTIAAGRQFIAEAGAILASLNHQANQ